MILTLITIALIPINTIIMSDMNKLHMFVAITVDLIGSYNINQEISDGCSLGCK